MSALTLVCVSDVRCSEPIGQFGSSLLLVLGMPPSSTPAASFVLVELNKNAVILW